MNQTKQPKIKLHHPKYMAYPALDGKLMISLVILDLLVWFCLARHTPQKSGRDWELPAFCRLNLAPSDLPPLPRFFASWDHGRPPGCETCGAAVNFQVDFLLMATNWYIMFFLRNVQLYCMCIYILHCIYIYYMFDCALHMYNIYIINYIIYICTICVCVLYHMHIVTPKTNGLEELEAPKRGIYWWITANLYIYIIYIYVCVWYNIDAWLAIDGY